MIPQQTSEVKSSPKKKEIIIDVRCSICADRAAKILKRIQRHKCPNCGKRHFMTVYGMDGLDILKALSDIEFDFVGQVR